MSTAGRRTWRSTARHSLAGRYAVPYTPQIKHDDVGAQEAGALDGILMDAERQAAIEKAKHEWECTADALSAMVCLLHADGTVLRANRVVEHWGLGSVSCVV